MRSSCLPAHLSHGAHPSMQSTRDMLPPLKVGGLLPSTRRANHVDWSYSPSRSVYSVRVPLGQGEMLRMCRTWFSPDDQQHARYLKPFTRSRLPDRNRQGLVVNVQGANTCTTSLPRRGF